METYYTCLESMLAKYDARSRKSRFTGSTAAEFETWRGETRTLLRGLLGLENMESCALEPRLLETVVLPGGISRETMIIQVEPGVWMPMYILIPGTPAPEQRCFLAPPGHGGGGKYAVAGCDDVPGIAEAIEKHSYDYGLQLAKMGHVAICPDTRGFGERRELDRQGSSPEEIKSCSCYHLAHMAEPLGLTVAGMATWDLMRLLDYVEARGQWPMDRIGCVGFSGGGMQTMWLSALDDRVSLAVISGYMYGYRDALLTLNGNCSCNYVPNLWLHLDMGDIAGLIAPRPVIIQSCRDDDLNGPRGIVNAEEQVAVIRHAYGLFGKEDRVFHHICPGGHSWHGEGMKELIEKAVRP